MNALWHVLGILIGRIVFALVFLFSGSTVHVLQARQGIEYARMHRVPAPEALVPLSGLFALRDRNVDLEAMPIKVEHGAYQGKLVPVKTRASLRRVDLSSTAVRVLRRQLLARKPNELGLVFPSPQGEILNDDNFRHRAFTPAVRRGSPASASTISATRTPR